DVRDRGDAYGVSGGLQRSGQLDGYPELRGRRGSDLLAARGELTRLLGGIHADELGTLARGSRAAGSRQCFLAHLFPRGGRDDCLYAVPECDGTFGYRAPAFDSAGR